MNYDLSFQKQVTLETKGRRVPINCESLKVSHEGAAVIWPDSPSEVETPLETGGGMVTKLGQVYTLDPFNFTSSQGKGYSPESLEQVTDVAVTLVHLYPTCMKAGASADYLLQP